MIFRTVIVDDYRAEADRLSLRRKKNNESEHERRTGEGTP